jgi:hypothetical protein
MPNPKTRHAQKCRFPHRAPEEMELVLVLWPSLIDRNFSAREIGPHRRKKANILLHGLEQRQMV